MSQGQRVGVRTGLPLTAEQRISDDKKIEMAITALGNADIAATQQSGVLTDAQKAQLRSQIDHLRAQMHEPLTLDEISGEPLFMLGIE